MSMNSVQATKHKLVSTILAQRTYTPASAVWCRLYNQLMKLAKDDLASLAMIISIKIGDCGGENHSGMVEEVMDTVVYLSPK